MTSGRRVVIKRVLGTVLALYAVGIGLGYLRLPWAAVKSLHSYELAEAAAVSLTRVDVAPTQLWYLRRVLPPVSPAAVEKRVAVSVAWNALVAARVKSGVFVGGKYGVQARDTVYVCVFGAWVPFLTYSRVSGWPADIEEYAGGWPVANRAMQRTRLASGR